MADPKRRRARRDEPATGGSPTRQDRPRSRPLGAPRSDQTGPTVEDRRSSGSGLHPSVEAEGAERWVQGKSEADLLADLRAYLARLRDDPHNIQDRLRVAAIQLRLGRVDEALIHYEGVVRGYVTNGQILSAIALCERILGIYPNLAHLQKLLAALYARAPRGTTVDSAVTPIHTDDEGFLVTDKLVDDPDIDPEDAVTDRNMVVDRLFAGPPQRQQPLIDEELRPTMRFAPVERAGDASNPIPLTHPKHAAPAGQAAAEEEADDEAAEGGDEVVLLTQPKKKH